MDYRVSPTALKRTSALATSGVGSGQGQVGIEAIPLILKPTIEIGEKGGKPSRAFDRSDSDLIERLFDVFFPMLTGSFSFVITARQGAMLRAQSLEQVTVSLHLGEGAISANCATMYGSGGQGAGGMRDRDKEERAAGTWAFEPREKVCVCVHHESGMR